MQARQTGAGTEPGRRTPEIPSKPAPEPEMPAEDRPGPEIPRLPPDPVVPPGPRAPEIVPERSPQEMPASAPRQ
jgi:hypothetical protein